MPRVFISSSSRDAGFVEREIVSLLKGHGVEVWYSKDSIETAAEWEKRIKHGLNACDWFLVVLSPRSVASDWVQSEVSWALEKRRDRVVPVLYEDCDPEDLHLKLRRIQYIDFRHDPESARRKLLAAWGLSASEADQSFGKAVTAISNHRWGEAASHLNAVLSRSPDNAEAKTLLDYAERQQESGKEAAAPGQNTFAIEHLPLDEPFPQKQIILWQPNTRGGVKRAGGKADGREVAVVVTQEVLLKVNRHVSRTLEHEVGGFLIGDHCRCPETGREFITIDHSLPGKFIEFSPGFATESWVSVNEVLRGKFRGKLLVGWYHSHPRMDVFLSRYDMDIQAERFSEPWMTALVLEPEKHRGGFFCWRGGTVSPTEPVEFYELLERDSRESVVAWENYSGVDPVTLQRPALKRLNTLTASAAPEAESLPPPRRLPLIKYVPPGAAAAAPSRRTSRVRRLPRGVALWAVGAAAVVLAAISFFAVGKLFDTATPREDAATSANSARAPGGPEAAETLRPEIVGGSYELPGEDGVLNVSISVDNLPRRYEVRFNNRQARVIAQAADEFGRNRTKIEASANIAAEIARMRANPDEALPLPVEVFDLDAPGESPARLVFSLEAEKLGLKATAPPAGTPTPARSGGTRTDGGGLQGAANAAETRTVRDRKKGKKGDEDSDSSTQGQVSPASQNNQNIGARAKPRCSEVPSKDRLIMKSLGRCTP